MPILPIALQLIQFAPHLMRYFGVGESSTAVAEKVVDIASQVTGVKDPVEALNNLKANMTLQMEFQQRVMDNEHELEKLFIADRADARKRDAAFLAAGTRNYRADFLVVSSYVIVAFIVWKIWTIPEMPEFVKATISLILGRVLGYIDQVFQFEFGSTKNNREKDTTIQLLSRKQ